MTFADPTVTVLRRTIRSPREPLHGEYCLNGRLVQRDARIRVMLWLVDAKERHVWGDSYEGTTGSIFDLLQRIVDSAVCGVVPGIGGAEIARIHRKDPEALTPGNGSAGASDFAEDRLGQLRKVFAIATRAMEMDPENDALPVAAAAYCQARLFSDAATASPGATRSLAHRLAAPRERSRRR